MSKLSPLNRKGTRERIKPGWTDDPKGFAICDGCGLPCMHNDLRPHTDYRGGMTPEPDGLMVCGACDDQPQPYFQFQLLGPDPVPLQNPRPDDDTVGILTTQLGEPITTQDDELIGVPS